MDTSGAGRQAGKQLKKLKKDGKKENAQLRVHNQTQEPLMLTRKHCKYTNNIERSI